LKFQIQKRGERRVEVQPEVEWVGDDAIIGSTQWLVPTAAGTSATR
jgi:hypothetical protein